jgi:beta-glucan synthesis-associated protein KRE6
MMTILGALISIFVLYPVISYYSPNAKSGFLSGTDQTNNPANNGGGATNSTSTSRTSADLIDTDTPDSAKSWAGLDGNTYNLVFSDEFNTEGRTFKPADDPFWEAVDLHDTKNDDLNWYDSGE